MQVYRPASSRFLCWVKRYDSRYMYAFADRARCRRCDPRRLWPAVLGREPLFGVTEHSLMNE